MPPVANDGIGWLAIVAICAAPIAPIVAANITFGRAFATADAVLTTALINAPALSAFACFICICFFSFAIFCSSFYFAFSF
jgi:hypothetical protein